MSGSIDYNDTVCLSKRFVKDMKGDVVSIAQIMLQAYCVCKPMDGISCFVPP
jgi:hypothetical protein